MGSVFASAIGADDRIRKVSETDSRFGDSMLGGMFYLGAMQSPQGRKFIEDAINKSNNDPGTFKAGLQQAGIELQAAEKQAAESQATEKQGIDQLLPDSVPPEIAQMLGVPEVTPEQQAQQRQLKDQQESRLREAQDKASFGKTQEFDNVMNALNSVNGLMQNR